LKEQRSYAEQYWVNERTAGPAAPSEHEHRHDDEHEHEED